MKSYYFLVAVTTILVTSFLLVGVNYGNLTIDTTHQTPIRDSSLGQSSEFAIDPLTFSTIIDGFGGGSFLEGVEDVAVDDSGNIYVVGDTYSSEFPTQNAIDSSLDGNTDCFLSKLSPDGSSLLFSTYIGGMGVDTGYAVEVDDVGNIYICGYTTSSDFPLEAGFDISYNASGDAFVMKINSAGTDIIWSTLLGGSYQDAAYDLALDSSGGVYVTGYTQAPEFSYNLLGELGMSDCFIVKLDSSGTTLEVSTLMSGGRNEEGKSIAVDDSGNIFVTGTIEQPYWPYEWPVVNAFQDTFAGAVDAFVAKLNSSGTGVIYNTFLGGDMHEFPEALALDDLGNVYIGGTTTSDDFPRFNPLDNSLSGYRDAFVTKINATGNGLIYSTFVGGSQYDWGNDLVIDDQYNVYLVGETGSSDIPLVHEYDDSVVEEEGFLTKLNSTGNGIPYATALGTDYNDDIRGVALDKSGNIVVVGQAGEGGFPVTTKFGSSSYSDVAFITSLHDLSDQDNDGLPDFDESVYGTNPNLADTDMDLMPDGFEVRYGLNPLQDDASDDLDSDGLTNYEEFQEGTYPNTPDSDVDTLNDFDEVNVHFTNPLSNDTDYDLMPDGWEVENELDPNTNDASLDPDEDGLSNLEEYNAGTNPHMADTDQDSLTDSEEIDIYGTDPLVADTDGDGTNDGDEVAAGTDPLVPNQGLELFFRMYMIYLVLIPLVAFSIVVTVYRTRVDAFIEGRQHRNLGESSVPQEGGDIE